MPNNAMNTFRAIALLGASLTAIGLSACDNNGAPGEQTPATPDVQTQVYTDILGVVARLSDGTPGSEFKIYHEHIPDFRTRTGEINVTPDGIPGMKAMEMPFPVAESVSLDGIEVGDKVRFTFEVNWGGSPPWQLTAIEEIDPDTEINFENKKVADQHDDHDGHDHGDHDHSHDGP